MRAHMTVPAVLIVLVGLAWGQYALFVPRPAACERPREELILGLDTLIEDGVKRVTKTHYDGWRVSLSRVGEDDVMLTACKTGVDGQPECYEQHYERRFGQMGTTVKTE